MTSPASAVRVRPLFRKAAIVLLLILVPAAALTLWDYLEARRLYRFVERIRARGERVYVDGQGDRPATRQQQEASRYYAAAAILARNAYGSSFAQVGKTIDSLAALSPDAVRRDDRLSDLQKVVESYGPFFDLLDRATFLDARGLAYGDEPRFAVPDRNVANVNGVRVAYLSFHGESDAASQALYGTLALDRVSRHLFRIGVDTSQSLKLLLTFAPPPESRLVRLQESYERGDRDDELERYVIDERAWLLSRVWPGAAGTMSVIPRIDSGENPLIWIQRPLVTRRISDLLQVYDKALEGARKPWPSRLDAARVLHDAYPTEQTRQAGAGGLRQYFRRFTGEWSPRQGAVAEGQYRIAEGIAAQTARRRVAIAVLAIERYRHAHAGTPPQDLGALVPNYLKALPIDPYTGSALRYRPETDRYRVYSVGMNRADDQGDSSLIQPAGSTIRLGRTVPKDIAIEVGIRF
jgi:hypothetical protein